MRNCWNWRGHNKPKRYGQFMIKNRRYSAHRVIWSIVNGPIKKGMVLDHVCENKHCVNPKHLRQVTTAINMINYWLRHPGWSSKMVGVTEMYKKYGVSVLDRSRVGPYVDED